MFWGVWVLFLVTTLALKHMKAHKGPYCPSRLGLYRLPCVLGVEHVSSKTSQVKGAGLG